MQSPELLKLLYLVSPALPVGAYAYSQGQEYAVDSGWLEEESALIDWIRGVLTHSVGTTDLPVLQRCYDAWQNQDLESIQSWNTFLQASRETKELLLEDQQLGIALARLLENHGIDTHAKRLNNSASFVVLFALAGVRWRIPVHELMHGFAWSWLENQVASATKAIPLGQTQAQSILMSLIDDIPEVVAAAIDISEEKIGAGLPGLALSSSLHERQYSRLFRS